ncbi:PAS domain S-box protein [Desulfoprunum benzoelyticum]|uniref:histidine kinase n=1 Tax=Desulfoprunum benzoelyticum TaxID=1506996 RepID=A0A840UUL7_9BACT|nr:ATP-binding protein [Desulfoprunum benzoelyticum]MBB5349472.1 PAS domain S-box-containing protein [Desulfoprunum benzoelyticum]MBM9531486.1 PAS domain S-box protein [Desulfoprunum benzoelyticum]
MNRTPNSERDDAIDHRLMEAYREMNREVLQLLNDPENVPESIRHVLEVLKKWTGFDAVAIRLQDADDYPYFAQQGFSEEFLQIENALAERTKSGRVCRDQDGNVRLECTCGLVISGRTDPANPFFTPGGSFWVNDSEPLLDIPPDEDPRLHPRNTCIHQKYASVALVPIRDKKKIVGLIQFNDRRKGCFTRNSIETLEGIAAHIGSALMREQAEAALRESETRYRSLFEHMINGFALHEIVVDQSGKPVDYIFREVNSAFERLTGLKAEDILNKNVTQAIPGIDQDVFDWIGVYGKVALTGTQIRFEQFSEQLGGWYSIVAYRPMPNFFATVFEDITERKKAEAALLDSEKQLQSINSDLERRVERRTRELQETQRQYLHAEKLAAIGRLSASIAHEFNNPLQGIMSILNGLKKRAILEEEDRELLDAAIDESKRIKDLISSLREFNRPSSGRKVMVDVEKSIDSILLLHKSDFRSKRIAVVLNYADQLPQIMAVQDQIKQVFLNLLANAADACSPSGGVITISTRREDRRVAVAISDTGIGIRHEQMDLLFQPFYTTKPEVKGTGLGLSICYGIVRNHQGEIRVESQPGKGSTFTVLLPINEE